MWSKVIDDWKTPAEYIDREAAIAKLTDLDIIEPNATMTDAKRLLADMPGAKAVSLHDIYRVIAGHSYYHGDRILAALSCIAEGKEVNPVRSADVVPVVHGRWLHSGYTDHLEVVKCSECNHEAFAISLYVCDGNYCPNCGARMDGGADND